MTEINYLLVGEWPKPGELDPTKQYLVSQEVKIDGEVINIEITYLGVLGETNFSPTIIDAW